MKRKTRFHDEWYAVYGYEMPPHVERLPIADIQQAIEFGRKKHQPSVPVSEEPIRPWDGHKEF